MTLCVFHDDSQPFYGFGSMDLFFFVVAIQIMCRNVIHNWSNIKPAFNQRLLFDGI